MTNWISTHNETMQILGAVLGAVLGLTVAVVLLADKPQTLVRVVEEASNVMAS